MQAKKNGLQQFDWRSTLGPAIVIKNIPGPIGWMNVQITKAQVKIITIFEYFSHKQYYRT